MYVKKSLSSITITVMRFETASGRHVVRKCKVVCQKIEKIRVSYIERIKL